MKTTMQALVACRISSYFFHLSSYQGQEACSPNVISHNAILSACERSACWSLALQSLQETDGRSRDVISFNTALSACVRSKWERAIGCFLSMQTQLARPDVFTSSALVRACESRRNWELALGLCIQMMDSKMQLNVVTYSAAISACQSSSAWQQALFLFGSMCSAAMLPNVISYSALLSACERGGQWERSLTLLKEMVNAKVLPDGVACGAALSACERGLQWELVLHLLFSMPVSKLKLDSVCYTSAISTCSRSGRWEDVLLLVKSMVDLGVNDFSIARYEHVSQAGSTLDVFKHSVFVMVLQLMTMDARPLTCIDTHAGPAMYEGISSQRGILRVMEASKDLSSEQLGSIQAYVRAQSTAATCDSQALRYLGSPLLALRWLRPQDHGIFFELSPEAFDQLKLNVRTMSSMSSCQRVTLHQSDSYWHLANQPESDHRCLILMDPPYDPYETYMSWNLFLLQELYWKWPQTCILMWFPYLDDAQVDCLYTRLKLLTNVDINEILVAEFGLQETQTLETSGPRSRGDSKFIHPRSLIHVTAPNFFC